MYIVLYVVDSSKCERLVEVSLSYLNVFWIELHEVSIHPLFLCSLPLENCCEEFLIRLQSSRYLHKWTPLHIEEIAKFEENL